MKLTFCVACGASDDLQHHHLVTRAEKGSDDESNLITLCCSCHAKLHNRQQNGVYNSKERIRDAKRHLASQGIFSGGKRPFGFDIVLGGETPRLVPNTAEMEIIEQIKLCESMHHVSNDRQAHEPRAEISSTTLGANGSHRVSGPARRLQTPGGT